MTDFTNTDAVAEYASAVENVLAVQWTGMNTHAMFDLCSRMNNGYGVIFSEATGVTEASVLLLNDKGESVWLPVVVGSWVYREQHGQNRYRVVSDEVFRGRFTPVPEKQVKRVKGTHVRRGVINANDLTFEHINCIVSITHKVVVANPDGPTHQQVHDYELDMLDYADKLRAYQVTQQAPTPPLQPADLPPVHLEVSAETTGPLQSYTQTEELFYLTVGGSQIVVERYDYLTIKSTPFEMVQPDLAEFLNDAESKGWRA